jgi:RNA polymerase sigma-70 factor (ECF subfamily)
MQKTQRDDGTAAFTAVRGRLFGIAYRMLGTVTDAEDVVQDAWLRWQQTDRDAVRDPAAFLATVATRLSITAATSARAKRVTYIGPWLPEPVQTSADPTLGAETAEAVELAVLVLLERLTPTERAAYILREAFGYGFREIGDVVQTSEANARQLAARARRHLDGERRRPVARAEHDRLLRAFLAAARAGDVGALEDLLAEDAVTYSDGGGLVTAARNPVMGAVRVAQFLVGVSEKFGQGIDVEFGEWNGSDAAYFTRAGEPVSVATIDVSERGIERVFIVLNPQKLIS